MIEMINRFLDNQIICLEEDLSDKPPQDKVTHLDADIFKFEVIYRVNT